MSYPGSYGQRLRRVYLHSAFGVPFRTDELSGRYDRGSGGRLGYLAFPVFGQGLRRTFPDVVLIREDFHRIEYLGKRGGYQTEVSGRAFGVPFRNVWVSGWYGPDRG